MTAGRVSAYTDDALGRDDLVGLLDRLARREVSGTELRAAAMARLEAVEPRLNAVMSPVGPLGGVAADGPFSGIPTLVKDNQAVPGVATSHGSRCTSTAPATGTSPWVAHALRLGLAPVATTALSEFGLTATTETLLHGATRNPWDTARSPGGSSGGSAALVAAGVVPLAHGNDGGGSIRIPAACCGLVGLKPTRNRLPNQPFPVPVDITVEGVLTRTVRDTAHYVAAAERDRPVPSLPPVGLVEGPSDRRLRIAVVTAPPMGLPVSDEIVAAVGSTADLLAGLGHEIVEAPYPAPDSFGPDFLRYWGMLAGLVLVAGRVQPGFDPRQAEPFTRELASVARDQAGLLPATLRRLRALARDHESVYDVCDVVLSPVLAHQPPILGHLGPDVDARTHLMRVLRYVSFTPLQNVSGSPAISLPLAVSADGAPLGVQLAAPFGHERRLLELAFELEAARPWAML
jgi:amidase